MEFELDRCVFDLLERLVKLSIQDALGNISYAMYGDDKEQIRRDALEWLRHLAGDGLSEGELLAMIDCRGIIRDYHRGE